MQLTVKPYYKNGYPRGGILVRGSYVTAWLQQVQEMGLSLEELDVYPLAGMKANTIWGCLLAPRLNEAGETGMGRRNGAEWIWPADIGSNVYCQCIQDKLFLPENSRLYPQLSVEELDRILKDKPHFFHPETGWVELPEPIRWKDLLVRPEMADRVIITPEETVFIPSRVFAFYKQALPYEEVLENMEQELFPGKIGDTRPLSLWEKIKLRTLRILLGRHRQPEDPARQGRFARWLSRLIAKKRIKWMEKLEAALDDLEERNNREVDKLLDLFKTNPEEALKYAIPIDSEGVSRGSNDSGAYKLSELWGNLSSFRDLFGHSGGSGGSGGSGSVRLGRDHLNLLNQAYRNEANKSMINKEYRQAAFIYLRLLKDYHSGADALEKGGFYAEAASVYLKYLNDREKAAACYEKGQMPMEAIQLYKDLGRNEKVGDLYLSIGKRKEARPWFEKVVEHYLTRSDYNRASLIMRDKLNEREISQGLLLKGWRADKDAVNCLNLYFSAINDPRLLEMAIKKMYAEETDEKNKEKYLQVLKKQFELHSGLPDTVRDLAYEIVAERIGENPFITSELQAFNKKDKKLLKDILLYRQRVK
jgi:tetratricopeptide (TPR) repeat protein